MYKDYPIEDYLRIDDECKDRVRRLIQDRYVELEEERDAINDWYPLDDLYLKWKKVDDEVAIISHILSRLDDLCDVLKAGISKSRSAFPYPTDD